MRGSTCADDLEMLEVATSYDDRTTDCKNSNNKNNNNISSGDMAEQQSSKDVSVNRKDIERRNGIKKIKNSTVNDINNVIESKSDKNNNNNDDKINNNNNEARNYHTEISTDGSVDIHQTISCNNHQLTISTIPENSAVITNYVILEPRMKYAVYKITVIGNDDREWTVHKRYSDFEKLNKKLRTTFPHISLKLPPKRYIGDNFDKDFMRNRQQGLEEFTTTILSWTIFRESKAVQSFFRLDDPPDQCEDSEVVEKYVDGLEKKCQGLEDMVKRQDMEINRLKLENSLANERLLLAQKDINILLSRLYSTNINTIDSHNNKENINNNNSSNRSCNTNNINSNGNSNNSTNNRNITNKCSESNCNNSNIIDNEPQTVTQQHSTTEHRQILSDSCQQLCEYRPQENEYRQLESELEREFNRQRIHEQHIMEQKEAFLEKRTEIKNVFNDIWTCLADIGKTMSISKKERKLKVAMADSLASLQSLYTQHIYFYQCELKELQVKCEQCTDSLITCQREYLTSQALRSEVIRSDVYCSENISMIVDWERY